MTIDDLVYKKITKLASRRGVTVQQFIRAVVLPEWLHKQNGKDNSKRFV